METGHLVRGLFPMPAALTVKVMSRMGMGGVEVGGGGRWGESVRGLVSFSRGNVSLSLP